MPSPVTAQVENIIQTFTGVAESLFEGLAASISTIMTGTRDGVQDAWNEISGWLDEKWQAIRSNADRIFTATRNAIEGAFSGLAAWVGGIFDDVRNRIMGAIDGIASRIEGIVDRVRGIFGDADRAERRAREAEDAAEEAAAAASAAASAAGASASSGGSVAGGGDAPMGFATGGIVTGPMRAIVGEAGPEAIIPLDRLDSMLGGGAQTIIVELDGRRIAESTVRSRGSQTIVAARRTSARAHSALKTLLTLAVPPHSKSSTKTASTALTQAIKS